MTEYDSIDFEEAWEYVRKQGGIESRNFKLIDFKREFELATHMGAIIDDDDLDKMIRKLDLRSYLMTEEEMDEELERGRGPLDISIEKWERVVRYCKANNDVIEWEVLYDYCYAETCALCSAYQDDLDEEDEAGDFADCTQCPYFKHYGRACCSYVRRDGTGEEMHWYKFQQEGGRNTETAQAMLDALKELKEEV